MTFKTYIARTILLIITSFSGALAQTMPEEEIKITFPEHTVESVPYEVIIQQGEDYSGPIEININGEEKEIILKNGQGSLELLAQKNNPVTITSQGQSFEYNPNPIPLWWSIVPPLMAILLALIFREVVTSLFAGILFGSVLLAIFAHGPAGILYGLMNTIDTYILQALTSSGHMSIILFSMLIGGTVAIISKNGGMQGIVDIISSRAKTARSGQLTTWLLGIVIFFDDYANTLVVGNTMRPVTDRLRISREKLAYIVDSTAAPVACLAFVTTWIGYEVGIIGDAVAQIDGYSESAYSIFLGSILYSFYPILAILFVFSIANSRRDFGPMYQAELRARSTGKVYSETAKIDEASAEGKELAPKADKPQRAFNAIIPILVLVGAVLAGLYATGEGESLRDIIGSANSY